MVNSLMPASQPMGHTNYGQVEKGKSQLETVQPT
jgi:hypothetical protein